MEVSRGTLEKKIFQRNAHFLPGKPRKVVLEDNQGKAAEIFKGFKNEYNDEASTSRRESSRKPSISTKVFNYAKPSKFNEAVWDSFKNQFS